MNNEHKFDDVLVIDREECDDIESPKRYSIVILNDDYTHMDWVIHILTSLFMKTMDDATRIMLHIHENGGGVAASNLSLDVAMTKANMVINLSQAQEHPLQAVVREED